MRVGVSGWSYPHWRGDFYPPGLRQRDELQWCAERMGAIELNASFYALQRPTSYAAWRDVLPPGVELAVKGSRFITHLRKLRDVEVPLANFLASGLLALGDALGPVLWQLPERLSFDPDRMEAFLDLLPRSTARAAEVAARHDDRLADDRALTTATVDRPLRHVLEPRHPSFGEPAALALLRRHGVGCVVADSAQRWPQLDAVTSDVVHVRLHGEGELYAGGYSPGSLDRWAERCRAWAREADVYVFFDNDARGRAPWDALALQERLS